MGPVMNSHSLAPLFALVLGATAFAGCGSSQSKPESAEGSAEVDGGQESEPVAEPEPEPAGPDLNRPVEDIITEPDNAWVVNFQSSEPHEKAGEQCDKRFKDNPKERASCMSKARGSFVADAMEFKMASSGGYQWVVYRAKGNRLIQIYSVPVSFGEEKAGVLEVKKAGSGKGTPPLFANTGNFEVKLLSTYAMELNDARHGRLTYDARIGFISK